jgi:beta-lysine 5,6-aminomutase alpha subunit
MSDRYLSIENAKYIFSNLKNIGDEVEFKEGGIIKTRASQVLENALNLLETINKEGLFNSLEKGIFGNVKRSKTGGKGLDGVVRKEANYTNPFVDLMKGGK